MNSEIMRILPRVQKPARYTGGEYGEIIKDKNVAEVRVAFCFPDVYEIGMSNLGLRILYGLLNEIDGVWCERAFAPWGDMESELRERGIPLYALESGDSLADFDIIAFSLGYELSYTNVLNMLDLAGIPIRSCDRDEHHPLVIAGGTCCFNPEPLADFLDIFAVGEGEELIVELIDAYKKAKNSGASRAGLIRTIAAIDGVYAPPLYSVAYNADGTVQSITPVEGAAWPVTKRIARDLSASYYPDKTIVPSTEVVHDRVVLELFRGCIRGCRFCQAGYVCRPVRSRPENQLISQGIAALKDSGHEEITLSSLSTSDYRDLLPLCDGLLDWCEPRKISLSLPSLRADNFSIELMHKVQKVRKSGLTFAPEAGTQRLRDVINKNVTEDDILSSCRTAFEGGWNSVKLYFMLGLPTETDEDVVAIAELARKLLYTWKTHALNKSRGVKLTVSTSCFVPKPHTPFQWEAQITMEEYERRVTLLRSAMRAKAITYNWHASDTSLIEAALSRGDRRLGAVIESAWRDGARLDSWNEYFSLECWLKAFDNCGLDPAFYANRERDLSETLPWSVTSAGVTDAFLRRERELAYSGQTTPDCRDGCSACGASVLTGGTCDE